MTLKQAGELTGWTQSRVRYLAESGRIASRKVERAVSASVSAGQAKGATYTVRRERIEVSEADVRRVMDQTPSESAYWRSAARVAKTLGVSRHAITNMCDQGRIRAVKGVLASGRTGWLIPRTEMPALWEHYDQPGMRRKQVRQRMIDGVMHYRCTLCEEYKQREEFRKEKSTAHGIQSRCKICTRKVRKAERDRKVGEIRKKDRSSYYRRRDRARKEGGEAHRRYEQDAIVPGEDLWRMIAEHHPDCSNRVVSEATGVNLDVVRRSRTGMTTVSTADRLLSGLGIGHLLDDLVEPPGLDGWAAGHRRCRGCARCDRVHMGRGYCYICAPLARRGIDPRFVTGWTRNPEVTCCRSCGTTERKHFLRGLCSPCFYRAKKMSLLDQYPPLYDLRPDDEGRDGDDGDRGTDAERRADRAGGEEPEEVGPVPVAGDGGRPADAAGEALLPHDPRPAR